MNVLSYKFILFSIIDLKLKVIKNHTLNYKLFAQVYLNSF